MENAVYMGLEIVDAEINGEQSERDALLTAGMAVRVNRHSSIVFEIGVTEPHGSWGVSLRGALLYRFGFRLSEHVSPFASAGGSWAQLARQACDYRYVSTPDPEVFQQQFTCWTEDKNSYGPLIEAGVDIKLSQRHTLTLKAAQHRGNDQTTANIFSVTTSF